VDIENLFVNKPEPEVRSKHVTKVP
jgi:hypothetical protein